MYQLRLDQLLLKADVYSGWRQPGVRNMLAVLPTGGGKSVITSDIILDGHNQGLIECVIAHRNELVSQMSCHIATVGVPHRIIAPTKIVNSIVNKHRRLFGRSFVNPDARCSVAGVDTLTSRADVLKAWSQQVDRWTIDEAHHVLRHNKWGAAVRMFPNAQGLGVTATPTRTDGFGLGSHHDGVFDMMAVGPSMRELIDIGALSDYEVAMPESDFHIEDDAITDGGDFSEKKMKVAADKSRIVGDVVEQYIKLAYGKRAIAFATDVDNANKMAAKFNAAGIPAAAVSYQTPQDVRDDIVERFRDGRIWVLINKDLFGEGFDVPACEVVIMARPTASLGLFLQMFGRALRTFAGKLFGLIIDHVGNWKRHCLQFLPCAKRIWSLDRREKRAKKTNDPDLIPSRSCTNCSRPYLRVLAVCPHCGNAPVVGAVARTIEEVDGDLTLFDRDALAARRAETDLETPASLAQRVAQAAGAIAGRAAADRQIAKIQAQMRLQAAIAQWAGIQRALGRDDSQSYRRFYLATGHDVFGAQALDRADMDALAIVVEGWCHV